MYSAHINDPTQDSEQSNAEDLGVGRQMCVKMGLLAKDLK